MKGIKCCGECIYYNFKTYKCTAGAKDTGKAEDPFYKDCQFLDVEPVRHGRWLCVDTDTERFFLCNRCKKKEYWETNYCPNCGAKMDGDKE